MKTLFFVCCAMIDAVLRPRKEGRVIALMYHSVSDAPGRLVVRPKDFAEQIAFIAARRSVIDMRTFLAWREGKATLERDALLVTIDDGYLDTYAQAFPILRERSIPFTLFLTSDLSSLPALGGIPRPTWTELREMARSGLMTVGLHGHRHLRVDEIAGDDASLDAELRVAADTIERELGVRPTAYAYAFGARDPRVPPYLATLGIGHAFGITDGVITRKSDPGALRRVQIDGTMGSALFRARTTGGVGVASRLKRLLGR